METRLIVAYGLILLIVATGVFGIIALVRSRRARRNMLKGRGHYREK